VKVKPEHNNAALVSKVERLDRKTD